jgi:hypothetical protein
VIVNGDETGIATFRAEVARPPVFFSVNGFEAVWLTVTDPKSYGEGEDASTGPDFAAASPAAHANRTPANNETTRPRANKPAPRIYLFLLDRECSRTEDAAGAGTFLTSLDPTTQRGSHSRCHADPHKPPPV